MPSNRWTKSKPKAISRPNSFGEGHFNRPTTTSRNSCSSAPPYQNPVNQLFRHRPGGPAATRYHVSTIANRKLTATLKDQRKRSVGNLGSRQDIRILTATGLIPNRFVLTTEPGGQLLCCRRPPSPDHPMGPGQDRPKFIYSSPSTIKKSPTG